MAAWGGPAPPTLGRRACRLARGANCPRCSKPGSRCATHFAPFGALRSNRRTESVVDASIRRADPGSCALGCTQMRPRVGGAGPLGTTVACASWPCTSVRSAVARLAVGPFGGAEKHRSTGRALARFNFIAWARLSDQSERRERREFRARPGLRASQGCRHRVPTAASGPDSQPGHSGAGTAYAITRSHGCRLGKAPLHSLPYCVAAAPGLAFKARSATCHGSQRPPVVSRLQHILFSAWKAICSTGPICCCAGSTSSPSSPG